MSVQLPIIINIYRDLITRFPSITAVCNKLEAQFNFQTLTANWYGDEEQILNITLALETPESFVMHNNELQAEYLTSKNLTREKNLVQHNNAIQIKQFSDDVIYAINEAALKLDCYVALTTSELELLELQPKLLAGLIQIKLQKVLNLIAGDRSLTLI
ncbi:hypothetical protein [Colwellia echini]|uniref:Uncharacterized protein n=1 Tax=Colwellia echini TaxID=1982103 RepID=A0ABY3MXU0_9GAMM|nr:hypothetical protein [Colwellia echini]TYK66035.1 hypothetical protein CWS31_007130 [Colwellia echini]